MPDRELSVETLFLTQHEPAILQRWEALIVSRVSSAFFENNPVTPKAALASIYDYLVAAVSQNIYRDLNSVFDALVAEGEAFGVTVAQAQQFVLTFADAALDQFAATTGPSVPREALGARLKQVKSTLRGVYMERPARGLLAVLTERAQEIRDRWCGELATGIISPHFTVIDLADRESLVREAFDMYLCLLRGEDLEEAQHPESDGIVRTRLGRFIHSVISFYGPKGFLIADLQRALGHIAPVAQPLIFQALRGRLAEHRLALQLLHHARDTLVQHFVGEYNDHQMRNYYNEVSIMLHRIKNKLTAVPTTLQTILMLPDEYFPAAGDPLVMTVEEAQCLESFEGLRKELQEACQEFMKATEAVVADNARLLERLRNAFTELKSFAEEHASVTTSLEWKLGAGNTETVLELLQMAYEGGKLTTELTKELQIRQNELYQRKSPTMEYLDVYEVISSAYNESVVEANSRHLTYTLDAEDQGLHIFGVKAEIKRPFAQVIENAIKYTPEGGSVRVRLLRDNDHVLFSVQDTGIGIPPGEEEIVFNLCDRCTNARDFNPNGTGTGLYNDRKIILHHNGRIWVESEGLGKGSTFFISLPIHQPPTREAALEAL